MERHDEAVGRRPHEPTPMEPGGRWRTRGRRGLGDAARRTPAGPPGAEYASRPDAHHRLGGPLHARPAVRPQARPSDPLHARPAVRPQARPSDPLHARSAVRPQALPSDPLQARPAGWPKALPSDPPQPRTDHASRSLWRRSKPHQATSSRAAVRLRDQPVPGRRAAVRLRDQPVPGRRAVVRLRDQPVPGRRAAVRLRDQPVPGRRAEGAARLGRAAR